MGKQKVSIVFRTGAPLCGFDRLARETKTEDGPMRYLNCSDVSMTALGFLRIVPVLPEDWTFEGDMALYVPPDYVAWMVEADQPPTQLGFVKT